MRTETAAHPARTRHDPVGEMAPGPATAILALAASLLGLLPAAGAASVPAAGETPFAVRTEAAPAATTAAADTLTLDVAIRRALDRNPSLDEARAALDRRSGARWADWGSFLPEVDAGLSFERTDATRLTFEGEEGTSERAAEPIEFTRASASQSLSFSWTVLDGGRRFMELKAGAARDEASRHRLADEERSVVADVKRAYFEALESRRLVEVTERQLDARRDELEATRHRLEAGAATRVDLLGARVEVDEARLRLLDARDRAGRAWRELRRRMGIRRATASGRPPLARVDVLPSADRLRFGALVERALSTDPALRALAADARAAGAERVGEWTDLLPRITAEYDLARAENGGADAPFLNFGPSDDFNTVSVELSWNVFDGFDRRERTARADADQLEAVAARRERALEIERRVGDLVAELRRRDRRLGLLRANRDRARERLELARASYEEGLRSFDEFQPFIDEAREAERSLVEERHAYLEAWADLEELTGDLGGPSSR